MSTLNLLIAIPTYNRAKLITTAIRSLMQQQNNGPRWSVLVVDNNSNDGTGERLRELGQAWPRLASVREVKPGSSNARNCALQTCRTDYLLFADDDSTFPTDYVDRALAIIDDRRPLMFGGPIHPWFTEDPPKWFREEYGSYSLPQLTRRARRISLSGANICFSTEALRSVGGYDTALGIHGEARGYGEETDVECRILQRYGPDAVWYDPKFVNFHLVRPDRYRWRPLLREHFQRGIARARVARTADSGVAVPDCLRPRAPCRVVYSRRWQNIAYERGLPVIRLVGLFYARLL